MKLLLLAFILFSPAFAEEAETPFDKFTKKAKEVGNKSIEGIRDAGNQVDKATKKKVPQENPTIKENEAPAPQETKPKSVKTTQLLREESFGTFMFGYIPITTWLPSKKTLSYTQVFNKDWSAEFEYSWASISFPVFGIDIGEISEKNYSLIARKYMGNSFHFIFGGYKNEFRTRIGNDILDRMSNQSINVFSVENMGAALGLGNRWQFQNGFTWGIDWFKINIPLFNKKTDDKILINMTDENDRSDLKKVTRRFESFPTFVLLGLHIGYTF